MPEIGSFFQKINFQTYLILQSLIFFLNPFGDFVLSGRYYIKLQCFDQTIIHSHIATIVMKMVNRLTEFRF